MKTKRLLTRSTKASLIFLILVSAAFQVRGQSPTYSCEIRNEKYISSTVFEFDIYLKQTGTTAFELSNFQTGLKLNPEFINGGSISVLIVPGSSELNSSQAPLFSSYDASTYCIKVAPRTPPRDYNTGITSGTFINTLIGHRVCTIRVTNTLSFSATPANYTWNFQVQPYNTIVAAFVPGTPKVNTIITLENQHSSSKNLTVLLEGLFDGTGNRKVQDAGIGDHFGGPVADQISIELMDAVAPYNVVYHADDINLFQNGKSSFNVPGNLSGNYYLLVKHRNSISICSATPISFAGTVDYNFTSSPAQAYQFPGGINPLQQVAPSLYAMYIGDIDQSGIVDVDDMSSMLPEIIAGTVDYIPSDLDGLGWVDVDDMSMLMPNVIEGVYSQSPVFGKSFVRH